MPLTRSAVSESSDSVALLALFLVFLVLILSTLRVWLVVFIIKETRNKTTQPGTVSSQCASMRAGCWRHVAHLPMMAAMPTRRTTQSITLVPRTPIMVPPSRPAAEPV